jgi:hypothetical protein
MISIRKKPDAAMSLVHAPGPNHPAAALVAEIVAESAIGSVPQSVKRGQLRQQEVAEHRHALRIPQLLRVDEVDLHLRPL